MATERLIGVDFGTSTSVIRVKRYEDGKPIGEQLETKEVVFGGYGATVPTLIMKKDDNASVCYYGYEAQQSKKKFTNFHGFKMDLESEDPEKRARARQLTEEFYAFLGKQYKSQSDGGHLGTAEDLERTIVSYPVKWREETKQFMLQSAEKAGFPNITGMDEAQAAIQAVTVMSADHLREHGLLQEGVKANVLLIDMGAGTTDLVLSRYTPGDTPKMEVLSTWPQSGEILFGGREIDELLKNFFREILEEEDADLIFRRVGADKFKSWKETTVSPALRNCDTVCDFEALDSCAMFSGIEMEEYCLDRAALESCLGEYLKQFPMLVNGCLQDAKIRGEDVDLVIITGGHSQWYFVREMLEGKLPQFGRIELPRIAENPARVLPVTRPQETVALGLAYSGIHVDLSETAEQASETESTEADPVGTEETTPQTQPEEVFGFQIVPGIFKATISDGGVKVNGKVLSGSVSREDVIFVCGGIGLPLPAKVRKIEIFGSPTRETVRISKADLQETDLVSLVLDGISLASVKQGSCLSGVANGAELLADVVIAQSQQGTMDAVSAAGASAWRSLKGFAQTATDSVRQAAHQASEQKKAQELQDAARRAETEQIDPRTFQHAQETEFELIMRDEGYIIKKYLGNRMIVSVPPVICGRKVVEIGTCAFGGPTIMQGNNSLEMVILPDTVRFIGARAFTGCFNLHTVLAHKDVELIGESAFWGCNKLAKMDFGMGSGTPGQLILPPSMHTVGAQAFARFDPLRPVCIFREVRMSRRTVVKNAIGAKTFDPKHCAVIYYD